MTVRNAFMLLLVSQFGCSPEATEPVEVSAAASARGAFAGYSLYVDPNSHAADQADLWRVSDPAGADVMDKLANRPLGFWLGDWTADVAGEVDAALDAAGSELRVFVAYDIPERDCGAYSSGGAADEVEYATFIAGIATGLAGRLAIVVLEPDALSLMDCLDANGQALRSQMLSDAVDTLSAAGAAVYLDAGDSNWIPAADLATRLLDAGVERAAGFALNVAHTEFSADEGAYAEEIRAIIGTDAHFVIDTGRNGLGPDPSNEWCNPLGRALGKRPTLQTGKAGMDARLWVKPPGESDGPCNGGPNPGVWWPEYARDLAVSAGY